MQLDLCDAYSRWTVNPRRILSTTLLGLLLISCAETFAAEYRCPKVTPDDAATPQYQLYQKPFRCEGYYTRKVSQKFIEVVSLTVGTAAPSSAAPFDVSLRTPFLPTSSDSAQILIQPLGAHPLYRVDLPVGKDPVIWNAQRMLDSTGVSLSRIGFLAALERSKPGELVITPVAFGSLPATPTVTATIRTSVELRALKYRVVAQAGAAVDKSWTDIARMPLYAWDSANLKIPISPLSGSYRVEVEATDDDKQKLPLLRFSIPRTDGK
jgi:hypothetical protein